MKIEQEQKFQPITIVLDTQEDAIAFWDLIIWHPADAERRRVKEIRDALSSWFSNEAKL
jgi:hypothetical protein